MVNFESDEAQQEREIDYKTREIKNLCIVRMGYCTHLSKKEKRQEFQYPRKLSAPICSGPSLRNYRV